MNYLSFVINKTVKNGKNKFFIFFCNDYYYFTYLMVVISKFHVKWKL